MCAISITDLPPEVITLVFEYLEPVRECAVPVDRRQWLSQESLDKVPESTSGSTREIPKLRLLCKSFAKAGSPLLCPHVIARFSGDGLKRLERLSELSSLATHVRKFSYLVPFFYEYDNEQHQRSKLHLRSQESLQRKVEEQRRIVQTKLDVRILKKAIGSFTKLQHVRLLRVADWDQRNLLTRRPEGSEQFLHLNWTDACSHASRTIGEALLSANVPWCRFSSPQISPQSAERLTSLQFESLSTLAARLTCLTMVFVDASDEQVRHLSSLFKTVFKTAVNMQAVHVGFASRTPLSLPIEEVFNHVTWNKLLTFGIHAWTLEADDILNIVLRHRERLKGLRLREVRLKEGSAWKQVLESLRNSMHRLEWVSLTDIGYIGHPEAGPGAEVSDGPLSSDDETADDSDDSEEDINPLPGPSTRHNGTNGHADEDNEFDDDDTDSESDREHEGSETEFLDPVAIDTPTSAPWCNCNGHSFPGSADDLDDDGQTITRTKRKRWEKWVLRRCPEHGE